MSNISIKNIVKNIDKVEIRFTIDIPEEKVKEGQIEFVNIKDAKKIVQGGIAEYVDESYANKIKEDDDFVTSAAIFTDKLQQAQMFINTQPIFYDRSGLFWFWNKKEYKWEMVDETDILNRLKDIHLSSNTISSKEKSEIIEALKQQGRRNIPEPAKTTWIQFKNKVVDIETDEIFEVTHKYHNVNPIPWKMGDSYDTPTMDKIFAEWVGEDKVQLLYEIISYCTIPDYPLHRIFCFVGAGMNGKSKFLELIERFLGSSNVTNTELDTLLKSRFEMAKMYKKLACVMGETDYTAMSKTSLLKKLTGGDQVGYEFKNKTPFDAKNYAKLLISTNGLPMTEDKSDGFYRRWMIIDFPNRFSEKKNILEDIPEIEYENLAKKCVKILKHLLKEREFTMEGTLEDRKKKYEDVSDPLQKFINLFVEMKSKSKVVKWKFKERFVGWMIKNGYREWSDTEIGTEMKNKGYEEKKCTFGDKRWMAWMDISLKSVQGVQTVEGGTTQPTPWETKLKPTDTLDTLDTRFSIWKNSGDKKATLSIDFIKNNYKITENEMSELKKQGLVLEESFGRFRVV